MELETILKYSKIFIPLIAFIIIIILESFYPLFKSQGSRITHCRRNITVFIINSIILYLLITPLTLKALLYFSENEWGLLYIFDLSLWQRFLLAIILFDLWMYFWHKMNHILGFLWFFHKMHHTDLEMDVTTAQRFHIGELLISSFLRIGIILSLGIDLNSLLLYETIMLPIIYFHHSNYFIPYRVDKILRSIITTPWMHWVHHSNIRKENNSNYGSIFSFWDRISKTFVIRKDPEKIQYGLKNMNNPNLQTVFGMLKTPFISEGSTK